jgi:hypothetical protein
MARRLESKAGRRPAARGPNSTATASIAVTELEAAAVSGFSEHTLKGWRLSGSPKGPRPFYMYGKVFDTAGEIRRWRTENSGSAGCVAPMRPIAEPQESKKPDVERASTGAQQPDGSGLAPVKSHPDTMKARLGGRAFVDVPRGGGVQEVTNGPFVGQCYLAGNIPRDPSPHAAPRPRRGWINRSASRSVNPTPDGLRATRPPEAGERAP